MSSSALFLHIHTLATGRGSSELACGLGIPVRAKRRNFFFAYPVRKTKLRIFYEYTVRKPTTKLVRQNQYYYSTCYTVSRKIDRYAESEKKMSSLARFSPSARNKNITIVPAAAQSFSRSSNASTTKAVGYDKLPCDIPLLLLHQRTS